jgi:cellulose 1,4-beta-cellobiosidase
MRRSIASACVLVAAAAAGVTAAGPPAFAAVGCRVQYTVDSQWPGGFGATVELTNTGDALRGWSIGWDLAAGQRVEHMWRAVPAVAGLHVTARNETYNGTVPASGKVSFGFTGSWTTANPVPGAFTLDGVACGGGPVTDAHVDNPYLGAQGYVNGDWSAKAAAEPGGGRVADTSTAVWIDRIAAITGTDGGRGVRAHLDAALAQAGGGAPVVVQFVLHDLPGRDCTKPPGDWELQIDDTGLSWYRSRYIDPIAAIMADPKYGRLRIVNIVEPDALADLIIGRHLPSCDQAIASGVYVQGIQYALNALHRPNVYNYLGIGHHAKLGWDDNFAAAVSLIAGTARGTAAGLAAVDGFVTNTADYSATTEPFFTIGTTVSGTPVRQSRWVDWNSYVDELTYAQAFRAALVTAGFPAGVGVLIDTSRNGWGGPARPTGPSTSTDVNTFVDQSRLDRRHQAGNWCNQTGAGLGERPRPAPAPGIDAYAWIKPPGESDGAAADGLVLCDPNYAGTTDGYHPTGALPDAPTRGAWFPTQFRQLMANAYPAL